MRVLILSGDREKWSTMGNKILYIYISEVILIVTYSSVLTYRYASPLYV